MICFAAFTPHSPLLMDRIGKEKLKHVSKTRQALAELAVAFQASQPEVVFVISTHSLVHETAFSVNLHDEYQTDFRAFGDHTTQKSFRPNSELITAIQRAARTSNIPFVLESFASLEYGSAVPLHFLTETIHPEIVPISYSGFDRKQHLAFGKLLKDVALTSHKRIAIIASGDLAHTLSTDAPMGYHENGKEFDDTVKRACELRTVSPLLTIDQKIIDQAQQCALRSLLILFGSIDQLRMKTHIYSYEAPFGVGYLVADFQPL